MNVKLLTAMLLFFSIGSMAQNFSKMEQTIIKTQIGEIAIYQNKVISNEIPIIFLHGVYFDHNLWDTQIEQIKDRTVIAIDMPLHGSSKTDIISNWKLDDCADMLIEILDSLNIEKVIAVGHSWGSMTIIRAAYQKPEKFAALGLCNMPFKEPSKKEIRNIKFQHSAMIFRKFYMIQAGKSLMGKESLKQNPDLLNKLIQSMSKLSNKEIKYTDKAVRINSNDALPIIKAVSIPMIAIVGEEDYVGIPPIEQTLIVKGGHVSPLEVSDDVTIMISKLTKLAK